MSSTPKPSKPKRIYTEEHRARKAAYSKIYEQENKAVLREKANARRRNNPKYRDTQLRYLYGISLEERDDMLSAQGNACGICCCPDPGGKGDWHVDHCHGTKVVRGILCHGCNTALGLFKDNPTTLSAAITYLGK